MDVNLSKGIQEFKKKNHKMYIFTTNTQDIVWYPDRRLSAQEDYRGLRHNSFDISCAG